MKTNTTQELKILAATLLVMAMPMTYAQGDALLDDTDDILNSEQINIDGTFKKQTAADRIEKMRKRLESQNEQMVQKKIEDIRIKQEQELAGKLKNAFRGNLEAMDEMDSVQTVQAAPQRIVAPAPVVEEEEGKNKIIPYAGVRQYNGEGIDSFESTVNAGLTMENMVHERFSVGLGVNYTTMDITDRASFNGFNNGFGFTNGDEISYTNLNLNLTGKFFITVESKIRPYVGAGVGYNRTTLKYDETNSQFINNGFGNNFGTTSEDSQVSGSNVSGSALIGAEVSFTNYLGLNLEFNYTRAFTSGFDANPSLGFGTNNDIAEANLSRLGNSLEESDVASLNIGFIVKF